jgi:hypothetical protein
MDDLPNPKHNWRHVVELAAPVAVFLLLAAAVLLSSYAGRKELRTNLLAGCIRSTEDRVDNAHGWRTAQQARATAYKESGAEFDRQAAQRYDLDAAGLEERAGLSEPISPDTPLPAVLAATRDARVTFCADKFPQVSFLGTR